MAAIQCQVLNVGAKVLCILVLTVQIVLLDYIFINKDENASDAGRYIWIALDAIVLIVWVCSLIWSHRYFTNTMTPKMISDGKVSLVKHIFKAAIAELPFAYVCWALYSGLLVAKILRMFWSPSGFAEALPAKDEQILLTPTGIKIVLSMAGIIFALLAYSHHNEVHNTKYRLLIDKLAHSASLDVLDCLMLLSYLFIEQTRLLLPYPLDKSIKAFGCICILLPIIPLFALRSIANRQDEKSFQLVLALNSALYLLFVNIPLLCIRMILWVRHEADVTTFLTKNVMAIVRDAVDIYLNVAGWWKDQKNSKPDQTDSALGSEERESADELEMGKVYSTAQV